MPAATCRAPVTTGPDLIRMSIGLGVLISLVIASFGVSYMGLDLSLLAALGGGAAPSVWLRIFDQPRTVEATPGGLRVGERMYRRKRFRGIRRSCRQELVAFVGTQSVHELVLEGRRAIDTVTIRFTSSAEADRFAAALAWDEAPGAYPVATQLVCRWAFLLPLFALGASTLCFSLH